MSKPWYMTRRGKKNIRTARARRAEAKARDKDVKEEAKLIALGEAQALANKAAKLSLEAKDLREQARACDVLAGHKLIEAKDVCPHGCWSRVYAQAGLSQQWQHRLIKQITVPDWATHKRIGERVLQKRRWIAEQLATPAHGAYDNEVERIHAFVDDCCERDDTEYHVDHFYPLRPNGYTWREGDAFVEGAFCGLNVPWNLQALHADDNGRKTNSIEHDMYYMGWEWLE